MSEITFRRIHGRIVPIKKKMTTEERASKVTSGTGTVIAGGAIGAGAGTASAAVTKKAAKLQFDVVSLSEAVKRSIRSGKIMSGKRARKEAKGQQVLFKAKPDNIKSMRFTKAAERAALKTGLLKNLNKGLKVGGLAISAAIIGKGIEQIYEGVKGKPVSKKEEFITTAAGAGSIFAFHSAFGKKSGIKNWFRYGVDAAKASVKK